jgi:hypothetical protein
MAKSAISKMAGKKKVISAAKENGADQRRYLAKQSKKWRHGGGSNISGSGESVAANGAAA